MTKLIQGKKVLFYLTILFFLITILFTIEIEGAENNTDIEENEKVKNPFYDYRKTEEDNEKDSETENDNIKNTEEKNDENIENLVNDLFEEESKEESEINTKTEETFEVKRGYQNTKTTNKIIEIKNKRIEPDFYWQGLISAQGKFQIILDYENQSHLLSVGDKLNGYQVINIDSAKVTLAKDNYIYYLNMRGE